MAILWEKHIGTTHYKVTQAGNSVRLYSNGVFHSQWNSQRPISGQLWELLFLPAFLCQRPSIRVLLLGVGGGAVCNLLNRFFSIEEIIGVDLDLTHLAIAKRWFKSETSNVKYHHANAVEWLEKYRGNKFDLVIDDLFGSHPEGEVLRAVDFDNKWAKMLEKNLSKKGIVVANFESIKQAKRAWENQKKQNRSKSGILLLSRRNENAIAAFSNEKINIGEFKNAMQAVPALDTRKDACKLDLMLKQLA